VWLSHMDSIDVDVGQSVVAGSQVGTGGNTGNTIPGKGGDGSHVDITMRDKSGNLFTAPQVQSYIKNNYASDVIDGDFNLDDISKLISGNVGKIPSAKDSVVSAIEFLGRASAASSDTLLDGITY